MATPQNPFELILASVDDGLTEAWNRFCGDLPGVTIRHGSILDVACDAVVSPANSFGFMDGGIDAAYLERFGPRLQDRVQSRILSHHGGELVVGTADIVETADPDIPYLIVAPTMRVPMRLDASVNPYLAARAVFRLVSFGFFQPEGMEDMPVRERVRTLAMPGLGTGVGELGPNTCARQVRAAFEDVVLGTFRMPESWVDARTRHQKLNADWSGPR